MDILFQFDAADAVARSVSGKLSDIVSVLDFGAAGDGVTDDTAAFLAAQQAGDDILIPSGRSYVLTDFRHGNRKRFSGNADILQGDPTRPAWSITSDVTTGQILHAALIGPRLVGHPSSTTEVLRVEALGAYAIWHLTVDITAAGGHHSMRMVTDPGAGNSNIFAARISVLQESSKDIGCILSGVYNQYFLHIANSDEGHCIHDEGTSSVFTQIVANGMISSSGQNATFINPVVENWVGNQQDYAMRLFGSSSTIINACVTDVPNSKASVALGLNAAPFNLIGLRVYGSQTPDYPLALPSGTSGLISRASSDCPYKLDQYVSEAVLENINFAGDCSTLTRWPAQRYGTGTYAPGALAAGQAATTTIAVTGAQLGDFATAAFDQDLQGVIMTSWVSASDTVAVRFSNQTTGTITLSSGTVRIRSSRA